MHNKKHQNPSFEDNYSIYLHIFVNKEKITFKLFMNENNPIKNKKEVRFHNGNNDVLCHFYSKGS